MEKLFACLATDGHPLAASHSLKTDASAHVSARGAAVGTAGEVSCVLRGWAHFDGDSGCSHALAARVAAGYRDLGVEIVERLRGSFAVVIVDAAERRLVAAVDRFAQQPLSYGVDGDTVMVGTAASDIARTFRRTPELDAQALHDFMLSHMVSAPDTVFRGVRKLLPGHRLVADANGLRVERYWIPDFDALRREQARADQVLDALQGAIEADGPGGSSGTFLSGGLDSSTVTGLLARSRGTGVKAFSVGFGVEEFDELHYARVAARHFDCEHIEYNVTADDIVELIPRIATAYDEPFGNSSAVPTFCCARLAREHGVDHLYAGDGGDELFAGNDRYVRQRVFEHYWRIPAALRRALVEPLASRFDPDEGWLPLQKFASYVRQARDPLPDRFESWNLIYREGTQNVFDAGFLGQVNTGYPFEKMREIWRSCPSDDLLDRMLWYDWKFTLADSDLPKVSTMCELAGVRVSYPMLDDDFVALSMRVASREKIRGSELRSFFRDAVRDFLPAETLTKHKHGFGLPFGVWLKTHSELQSFVYGSLDALADRGILATAFLDRVAHEHRTGHAGYYGYAIWDLVMLEQWLQAHIDHSARETLTQSEAS